MNLRSNLQLGSGLIAIAEVLTDMDVEQSAPEQRREKTCTLKQAMMQELLTGKTRLL
jgi:type I restriction enzyme S subunit